jgi:c-di-GMP-binding flagellar brake protein YcgR
MDGKPQRFEDLKLLPGQALQLEFDGYSNERDRALLVGYMPGRSIIVSTPVKNGSPLSLKNGMSLAVRFFATQINSACAFKTEIVHVSRAPFAHLHLAIPKELVLGEVRSSVRANVKLICSVMYGADCNNKTASKITDLSLGGARLECASLPVEEGQELRITAQLTVSGIDRIITLVAITRSVNVEEKTVSVGVQFTDMSDSDRIMLHAYVLSYLNN